MEGKWDANEPFCTDVARTTQAPQLRNSAENSQSTALRCNASLLDREAVLLEREAVLLERQAVLLERDGLLPIGGEWNIDVAIGAPASGNMVLCHMLYFWYVLLRALSPKLPRCRAIHAPHLDKEKPDNDRRDA